MIEAPASVLMLPALRALLLIRLCGVGSHAYSSVLAEDPELVAYCVAV